MLVARRDDKDPDLNANKDRCLASKPGFGISFPATNPRNKIFALLGVASDGDAYAIHVTYSQAPTTVFCTFARLILSEGIELLYQATERFNHDVLPSWVPVSCQGFSFDSIPLTLMARNCSDSVLSSLQDWANPRTNSATRILECNSKSDFAAAGSVSSAICSRATVAFLHFYARTGGGKCKSINFDR